MFVSNSNCALTYSMLYEIYAFDFLLYEIYAFDFLRNIKNKQGHGEY